MPVRMATLLSRQSLGEQVYEALKRKLVQRELNANEKLSLHELAREFGVSRAPVHHALTRLVSDGLLSVRSRSGYYVVPLTATSVAEAYEVRLALELRAAEVSVGNVDPSSLRRFRLLLAASIHAVPLDGWDSTDSAFHEHQVMLAGNQLLARCYGDVSLSRMAQLAGRADPESCAAMATEHESIVVAFESGDGTAAKRAIRRHLESERRLALSALDNVAASGSEPAWARASLSPRQPAAHSK